MSVTKRQQEVLSFIRLYRESHGYSPSRREITEHFGWSGPNAVQCHLRALRKRGLITWTKKTARSLRILDQASVGTEAGRNQENREEVAADAI